MLVQIAQNVASEKLVGLHINLLPVIAENAETLVPGTLVISLLAVATDTHRLIIPIRVAAPLALGDDMVTVHENRLASTRLARAIHAEQVNVMPAALVNPRQKSVALTTAAHTLATMNRKRLEIGDVEPLAFDENAAVLAGTKTAIQSLLERKSGYNVHWSQIERFVIKVKKFRLSGLCDKG